LRAALYFKDQIMPKARVNGVEIHYEAAGSGTPVMLVAGYGGVGSYWAPQIAPFARHFQPILHDHRGHGQSTHDTSIEYSVDQMADDIIGLMDQLGIEKAHYVGHSLGGFIGQNMGLRHADRFHSLVLYAPITHADAWIQRCMNMRVTMLRSAGPRAFVRTTPLFLYPNWWINENDDKLAELEERSAAVFPPSYVIESRTRAIASYHPFENLHKIELPTLLVCAEDDFLTPPYFTRRIAEKIKHAELKWIERGGHACSQTAAEEFNLIVLDFLTRHD
jgi:aminoacrylate hydrolase